MSNIQKPSVIIPRYAYGITEIKLIFFNRKIEIYKICEGLEMFLGYLTYHDSGGLWPIAKAFISQAISKDPLSSNTLTILECLQFQGMLPEQGLI